MFLDEFAYLMLERSSDGEIEIKRSLDEIDLRGKNFITPKPYHFFMINYSKNLSEQYGLKIELTEEIYEEIVK